MKFIIWQTNNNTYKEEDKETHAQKNKWTVKTGWNKINT